VIDCVSQGGRQLLTWQKGGTMSIGRTFVDALGRTIQIPSEPQRLVSLVPSITETLFCFGKGAQVVGITDYCTEPAREVAQKRTIGGTKNPDIPALVALRPQLVFAVAEENRQHDVAQLEQAGIPVYVFEPVTVRDGIDLLWQIADVLQCRHAVTPLVQAIEATYADTLARVAGRTPVRVFCPIWKDPYMTIGDGTYVHDMLRVCGGHNIFAQRRRRFPLAADLGQQPERTEGRDANRDRRYPRITLEEMAALQPEVILLPDEPYVFSHDDLADFAPFPDLPAVRDGRIHLLDGKVLSWYGPRIGDSLRTLRHLLVPDSPL
jgi:ABC-type Fe3+-hydroxamate transport system substrate-binding protein